MQPNLDVLIENYRDASWQLEKAIFQPCGGNIDDVRQCDKKLVSLFEKIINLELDDEQCLTRINFVSELFLTNYANEDALGCKLVTLIRNDAKLLNEAAVQ